MLCAFYWQTIFLLYIILLYIFLGQCTVISNLVINTHKFASVGQKATTAAVSQQCMHSILLVVVNNIVHSAHLYTLAISKTLNLPLQFPYCMLLHPTQHQLLDKAMLLTGFFSKSLRPSSIYALLCICIME